jgi:hypothetical protein
MTDWHTYLSTVADALSVVGFIITIKVFLDLRKIKSFYVFKGRIPELIRNLDAHAARLASYYDDHDISRQGIKLELAQAEVTLNSIRRKVDRPTKRTVDAASEAISAYDDTLMPHQSRELLWNVYIEIRKAVDELVNRQKDVEWEK